MFIGAVPIDWDVRLILVLALIGLLAPTFFKMFCIFIPFSLPILLP